MRRRARRNTFYPTCGPPVDAAPDIVTVENVGEGCGAEFPNATELFCLGDSRMRTLKFSGVCGFALIAILTSAASAQTATEPNRKAGRQKSQQVIPAAVQARCDDAGRVAGEKAPQGVTMMGGPNAAGFIIGIVASAAISAASVTSARNNAVRACLGQAGFTPPRPPASERANGPAWVRKSIRSSRGETN
jgi:hypothetical protein